VSDLPLWKKTADGLETPLSFDLELTARCNNNCRHCYINLSVNNKGAAKKELTAREIHALADEAVSLGAVWCLINGGEPLLRPDFPEIYLSLKRKGLLVSVFTNATLITGEHVKFFKDYPPRLLEVTVYGITEAVYERVSRAPGSFRACMKGLDLLLENGVPVRLKAMALRSNIHELPAIREFCRTRTKDYFRFDPLLHLRYDGDPSRNEEIRAERLTPNEIVALEKADTERFEAMKKGCDKLIDHAFKESRSRDLFTCGAGLGNYCIGHDGRFRLCSSLWHPDCLYDLRTGSLTEAVKTFVPKVRKITSERRAFLEKCRTCSIINLCLWCPAHAYLEFGEMDQPVQSFCEIATARVAGIRGEGPDEEKA
jgi:radical SAM protein with 4Fe4S-binding SPASM domain